MTASPELYGLVYYSYESHQTEPEIRFASRARRSVAGVQPLRTDAKTGGIRRAGSQQSNAGRTGSGRQRASTQSAIRLDGRQNTLPVVRRIVWNFRSGFSRPHLHGRGLPVLSGKEAWWRRSRSVG